jgi:hypothetical protein
MGNRVLMEWSGTIFDLIAQAAPGLVPSGLSSNSQHISAGFFTMKVHGDNHLNWF